jgi:hypothetical protein
MSLTALLGATEANSYLTVAEGDAFAGQALGDIAWNNTAEQTDKEKALVTATRWLDTLDYVGTKCDPQQPLKWPRSGAVCGDYVYGCETGVPPQVEQAAFAVANVLLGDPAYIIGGIPGSGGGGGGGTPGELVPGIPNSDLKELTLDVMKIVWKDDATGASGVALLEKLPVLGQILGCLTTTVSAVGSSRVLQRVRS